MTLRLGCPVPEGWNSSDPVQMPSPSSSLRLNVHVWILWTISTRTSSVVPSSSINCTDTSSVTRSSETNSVWDSSKLVWTNSGRLERTVKLMCCSEEAPRASWTYNETWCEPGAKTCVKVDWVLNTLVCTPITWRRHSLVTRSSSASEDAPSKTMIAPGSTESRFVGETITASGSLGTISNSRDSTRDFPVASTNSICRSRRPASNWISWTVLVETSDRTGMYVDDASS